MKTGLLAVALSLTALPAALSEGVLSLGKPAVSGNSVTVPVFLQGDVGSGVAALDFTLRYDPAVLAPAGVRPGDAAVQADKGVQFNMTSPGKYVVMMFGLNQTTLQGGKVAEITLRTLGRGNGAQETSVAIDGTTLASLAGQTIASRGSSATVPLAQSTPPGTDPGSQVPSPGDTSNPTPAKPPQPASNGAGEDSETSDGRKPSGTPAQTTPPAFTPGLQGSGKGLDTLNPALKGMPAAAGPTLSEEASDSLAKLQRAAREFERRRAALPTPETAPDTAPEADAGPAAASGTSRTEAVAEHASLSKAASNPQVDTVLPEKRQVARLSPSATRDALERPFNETPPTSGGNPSSPAPAPLRDTRLWVIGALAVLFAGGVFLRRRIFS